LSFSSAPRGARSGEKSIRGKKTKKQKREFRTSKKHPAKVERVDLPAVKARTLEGLSHLGTQKLSAGPGNYDLKHWLKSLSLLLDDFEEKMKDEKLPDGYSERRKEITERFSAGVDTSQITSEAEAIRKEEMEIMSTFDREKERIVARLNALRAEKEGRAKDVEAEKAALQEILAKRKSASFFSKLVGKSGPPTEPTEQKIRELEKAMASLDEEGMNLNKVRASIEREGGTPSGLYEQQWIRVDAIKARLKEIDVEVEEKLQLAKEREAAMASLSETISKIEVPEPPVQK